MQTRLLRSIGLHLCAAHVVTFALLFMSACSHRDAPKCFDSEAARVTQSPTESKAVADARKRAKSCNQPDTQCDFHATTQ